MCPCRWNDGGVCCGGNIGDQVVDRDDAGYQAAALGFLGIHHAPGQAHFHRLRLASKTGQALSAAGAR